LTSSGGGTTSFKFTSLLSPSAREQKKNSSLGFSPFLFYFHGSRSIDDGWIRVRRRNLLQLAIKKWGIVCRANVYLNLVDVFEKSGETIEETGGRFLSLAAERKVLPSIRVHMIVPFIFCIFFLVV
jgi:hypothetical protein